jgi:geranylgeranyl diphosphate synthase type II
MRLPSRVQQDRRLVDATLRKFLPRPGSVPVTVRRAMAYSLFPGGKRLRPILAIAACRALGGRVPDVLPMGCAIEMIHTYSLIHDDLPALDNDDLRRGRATSHRVFGEAMAILAGDALLTHAFQIAAGHPEDRRLADRKVRAMALLARAAGVTGMIGGQVMDLEAEGRPYSFATLVRIHRGKTGALISAAVQIGGIMAGGGPHAMKALSDYGDQVGLAFQIIDDILDREGSTDRLGKTTGKDARARKATYPALLGTGASRLKAEEAARGAERAIARLGRGGRPLADLARFIVDRVS